MFKHHVYLIVILNSFATIKILSFGFFVFNIFHRVKSVNKAAMYYVMPEIYQTDFPNETPCS